VPSSRPAIRFRDIFDNIRLVQSYIQGMDRAALLIPRMFDPARLPPPGGSAQIAAPDNGEDRMAEIRTTHLFKMTLEVAGMQPIGATPAGNRRIGLVAGGTFEGARLRGTVLPGGADWIVVRPDGVTTLDVRLVLETDDGAAIGMTYRGLRHGPPEVMDRLNRGEIVDPSTYYFRIAVAFETAAAQYAWLNSAAFVGTGDRTPTGPIYDVFEVL
jgi:hypothetical protein